MKLHRLLVTACVAVAITLLPGGCPTEDLSNPPFPGDVLARARYQIVGSGPYQLEIWVEVDSDGARCPITEYDLDVLVPGASANQTTPGTITGSGQELLVVPGLAWSNAGVIIRGSMVGHVPGNDFRMWSLNVDDVVPFPARNPPPPPPSNGGGGGGSSGGGQNPPPDNHPQGDQAPGTMAEAESTIRLVYSVGGGGYQARVIVDSNGDRDGPDAWATTKGRSPEVRYCKVTELSSYPDGIAYGSAEKERQALVFDRPFPGFAALKFEVAVHETPDAAPRILVFWVTNPGILGTYTGQFR